MDICWNCDCCNNIWTVDIDLRKEIQKKNEKKQED